jgi:hypothetical protein
MNTDLTNCTIRQQYEYELKTNHPTLKIVANLYLNYQSDMTAAYTRGLYNELIFDYI